MLSRFFLYAVCAAVLTVSLAGAARAEFEQQNVACGDKTCVKWWPKVAVPSGWHAELEEGKEQGVLMFAPDVQDSAARIYTYALRKSDTPKLRNLDDVIARDKEIHGMGKFNVGKTLSTVEGLQMRTILYPATENTDWDRVAYGEDGDFFIIFTLTGRTLREVNKHTYDFETFFTTYRRKMPSQEPSKP